MSPCTFLIWISILLIVCIGFHFMAFEYYRCFYDLYAALGSLLTTIKPNKQIYKYDHKSILSSLCSHPIPTRTSMPLVATGGDACTVSTTILLCHEGHLPMSVSRCRLQHQCGCTVPPRGSSLWWCCQNCEIPYSGRRTCHKLCCPFRSRES